MRPTAYFRLRKEVSMPQALSRIRISNSRSASPGGPDCCRIRNSGQPAGSPSRKCGSGPPSGTGLCTRSFRVPSARSGRYKGRFPDQRVHSCARGCGRADWMCRAVRGRVLRAGDGFQRQVGHRQQAVAAKVFFGRSRAVKR